ncbi:MAG: LLM class flavin-dependent oxidoreductase [Gammaproteobacteria bacterium]|nr:LLM class flavin-dependent oxidoreductase [Gammaproteobacteria bacterium]
MELTSKGVFLFSEGLSAAQLAAAAQRIEGLGYGAVWFPEAVGREPFAKAAFILASTERLVAATGIVNIYGRDPMVCAMGQQTLNEQSGGRFLLGLGVSHSLLVSLRGHEYGKPVATMRSYLEQLRECHKLVSVEKNLLVEGMDEQPVGRGTRGAIVTPTGEMPVILAALGPKMTALAGTMAQGSHPANTTPEHTAKAREILGPGPWLAPFQRVCLTRDAARARAIGRQMIGFYLQLPNYRNVWLDSGFTNDDFEHGGSDRLVDAMLAWGDENAISRRVQAHLDAGADHVPVFSVDPQAPHLPCWRALEAIAAG